MKLAIFLFLGGLLAAAPAAAQSLGVVELAPGNFVHYGVHDARSAENLGDNANIGFIVGSRCVLVVDTGGSFEIGRRLRESIRAVTDRPVCYVVITHTHQDHFFGAAAFLGDNPQFIGHENLPRQLAGRARPYLKALQRDLGDLARGSEIVQPTRTIASGETLSLDLGGRSVDIRAWPPAHTDDDLTVFDRATATFWLADLLFIDHTPVLDSNITGFLEVMTQLREMAAEHYVAGHGRSDAPWPRPLAPQARYFHVILDETRAAIKRGDRLMDAVNRIGLSEQERWINFETYHRRNVTTAWTELEWE